MKEQSVPCKWSWPSPLPVQASRSVKLQLVNACLFQLGWLVAVQGHNGWALATAIAVLAVHYLLLAREGREWWFIVQVALCGYLIDSLLTWQGVFVVRGSEVLAPLWLLSIWLMFGTTLCHSLAWLQQRLLLALLLGAIFPPFSYWAGEQLAPLSFSDPTLALPLLAAIWAVLLPAIFWRARAIQSSIRKEYDSAN